MKKIRIATVSVGRSDFNYIAPIIKELEKSEKLEAFNIVTGSHLSKKYGMTYKMYENNNIKINEKIKINVNEDSDQDISKMIAKGINKFSEVLASDKFDMVMIVGDRYETFAVAAATIPFNIPLIHIDGGDVTEGAIDDKIRHSITKLSHLHFVSNNVSAKRIISMGEEPWRVFCTGSPVFDFFKQIDLLKKSDFFDKYNLNKNKNFFILTYHPVTLEIKNLKKDLINIYNAIKGFEENIIITYPNADTDNQKIIDFWKQKSRIHDNFKLLSNMGSKGYFSAMKYGSLMIGNSSSGIYESPAFKIPVVNIGDRQKGREQPSNVVQTDCITKDIKNAIKKALEKDLKKKISNPYFKKNACKKIVKILERIELNNRLLKKKFYDNF